jgi:hypothetical protein
MYTSIDIAYNDNSSDLDKMARELNNKKENLFKSVEKDYIKNQKKWENDIVEYNNSYKNPHGHYNKHPESESNESKASNASNDSNNTDFNTDYYSKFNDSKFNDSKFNDSKFNDSKFNDIDSISIESPSLDSYIESVKKYPNKKNSVHSFIKKLDQENCSKDDNDIFTHVKYCYDCREKLLKYMKKESKHKNTYNNKLNHNELNDSEFNDSELNHSELNDSELNDSETNNIFNNFKIKDTLKNKESLFSYFGTLQNKEIFLIIILGIIIIIFLDFLMKSPYSIR